MKGTYLPFDQLHNALMALMNGYLRYEPMGWESDLLAELEDIRTRTAKRGQMQVVVREHHAMCEMYVQAWVQEP